MKSHRFPVIPALILFIFVLILFLPSFLGNRGIFHDDQAMEEFPRYYFVARNLQKGNIPFWDPHTWCGAIPFYARYYANTYYLPLWPFFLSADLTDLDQAYIFLIMIPLFLHYWLASLGMFFFLKRVIKISAFSSLVGALFYIFSPAFSYAYVWQQVVVLQSWLPWLLVLYYSLKQRIRLWKFIVAGVIFNFIITAACPSLLPFVFFIWLALIIPDTINRCKQGKTTVYRPLLVALVIVLIGCCLSAVYLLSSFEGVKHTEEHLILSPQASLAEEKGSLHPVFLSTLFIPDLFGNITGGNFDKLNPVHDLAFWDANLSGGVFVSFFVFLSFLIFSQKKQRRESSLEKNLYFLFFILLYLFSILCVLGRHTPFYLNLIGRLPLIGQLPRPVRYRLIQCFSAAVLGGYAVDYLKHKSKLYPAGLKKKALIYISFSFIIILLCVFYPFSQKEKKVYVWSEQPLDSVSESFSGTSAIGRYSSEWPVTKLRVMFSGESKGEIRLADDSPVSPYEGKLIKRYNVKNPGWHEFDLNIPPHKFFWFVSSRNLPIGYKRAGTPVRTFSYKEDRGIWGENPYINSLWFIQQKEENIVPLYRRIFDRGPLSAHVKASLVYWLAGILLILGGSFIFSANRAVYAFALFAAAELMLFSSFAFYGNSFNSYEGPNFIPHRKRYSLPSQNPILRKIVYDIPELQKKGSYRFASDYPFYDNFSRINGGYSLMGYEMHPLERRFKKAIEEAYGMDIG
ncbi:MAG: hypothetical protein GF375_00995, partial [Candidatus Omnitrophica bacterium]|nr:hypothetical protein [Candidatus Omnitrophota bacterium]MBD3268714.1 hypothetical protein [Candidatus Omnitrophota bacterium]